MCVYLNFMIFLHTLESPLVFQYIFCILTIPTDLDIILLKQPHNF